MCHRCNGREDNGACCHFIVVRCRNCGATGCTNQLCNCCIYPRSHSPKDNYYGRVWSGNQEVYVKNGYCKRCGAYNSFEND